MKIQGYLLERNLLFLLLVQVIEKDASRTMEIDAETVTAQSGAADHSSRRFRLLNPVLVLINLRWRMIIP